MSRSPKSARLGWAALFSVLLALAFPFRAADLRFDLGSMAGWVALVPLLWMLRGLGPRAAFGWATAAALPSFAAILYWLFVVVNLHGQAPVWASVGAVLVVSFIFALHVGLAGAVHAALSPHAGRLAVWVLPSAWVVTEHLRSFDLFGGFPWAYLGYAMHGDGPILELAALGGVFGLSFLQASVAGLIATRRVRAALIVGVAAHLLGFGLRVAHTQAPVSSDPPLRVALVQESIPQLQKWEAGLVAQAFAAHLESSRLAAAAGELDLIVWPETAAPVLIELQPDYADALRELARETGAVLVVGSVGFERAAGELQPRYYNSALVVRPDGGIVDRYDKSHLVPFGEYVPLRRFLGSLSAMATGLSSIDVTPGAGPRVLRNLPEFGTDHALAVLICYEVIYPSLVREAVREGARVLLNLTNDAWYGRTSAPHQFLAIAAMRSAEHGLPMLRAANTGVSAIVDAGGTVRRETPIFEAHVLRAPVPPARAGPTLYTRFGDWIVWVSWGFLIVIVIAIGGRRVVGTGRYRE